MPSVQQMCNIQRQSNSTHSTDHCQWTGNKDAKLLWMQAYLHR